VLILVTKSCDCELHPVATRASAKMQAIASEDAPDVARTSALFRARRVLRKPIAQGPTARPSGFSRPVSDPSLPLAWRGHSH
jgi:hypothetical protein